MKSDDKLARRLTVAELCSARDEIRAILESGLALLQQAMDRAASVGIKLTDADHGHDRWTWKTPTHLAFSSPAEAIKCFVKFFDAQAWSYLFNCSGMSKYMGANDLDAWTRSISGCTTPELTDENVASTFRGFWDSRDAMREKAVIDVVRELSWDYRSNSPIMLTPKIILTGFVDRIGYPSDHRCAKLDDLHRMLLSLQGRTLEEWHHSTWQLLVRQPGPAGVFGEHDFEFFKIRVFKNRNAHVLFRKEARELLGKMNQILAKHFPCGLPPKRDSTKRSRKVA